MSKKENFEEEVKLDKSAMSPLLWTLWLLLTFCVLIYMLPIILVCGLLGMSITARNRMNAAFVWRDGLVVKQIDKSEPSHS